MKLTLKYLGYISAIRDNYKLEFRKLFQFDPEPKSSDQTTTKSDEQVKEVDENTSNIDDLD